MSRIPPEASLKGVVFDLDDTLYRETDFVFGGYRSVSAAVRARYGFEIADELIALFRSGQRGDLFTPVLRRHLPGVEERYVKELVAVYREHQPDLSPLPAGRAVLEALRANFRIGLITDGIPAVQRRKFAALGIAPLFDAAVFSDDFGIASRKPHPRPYEECARRLDIAPSALVYVGDNPAKDFVTARRLGWRTVRLRLAGGLHAESTLSAEFEADREIADLPMLPAVLSSLERMNAE